MYFNTLNELFEFNIHSSESHSWACYENGRSVVYKNTLAEADVLVNTKTQEVYEVYVFPLGQDGKETIRWINPKYRDAMYAYRDVKHPDVDVDHCWTGIAYIDINDPAEFLATAGEMFGSTKMSSVDLELEDGEMLFLANRSIDSDITVRQLILNILRDQLKKETECHKTSIEK